MHTTRPVSVSQHSGASPAPTFPFSAIVGHDDVKLALILTAISPAIGGVLIRGEKGTAKTTTVRSFATVLQAAQSASSEEGAASRLVNLPLGATEDRVVGSLDIESVLTTGHATFQPGLLSQADQGILYVDEVNLLADHLVDAILDAASTGSITVERDSISFSAQTRFVLVGTMNPEEGELRPQLLDRFGFSVEVKASKEPAIRREVLTRRLDFERDPDAFLSKWISADKDIASRIRTATERIAECELTPRVLGMIASLCAQFDVDGMRADLVIARAAQAHCAWEGRKEITDDDIAIAAKLALAHRKRRNPFDEPGLDDNELEEAMDQAREDTPDTDGQSSDNNSEGQAEADSAGENSLEASGETAPEPEPTQSDDSAEQQGREDNSDQSQATRHSARTPDQGGDHNSPRPDGGEGGRADQGAPFR